MAVVVLLYNSEDVVSGCLDALAATRYRPMEVIVVDNASADGSVAAARAHPSGPRVVENDDNLGWAGGNNVGIVAALREGFDHVALLNPDVMVAPEWLDRAVGALAADPGLAMVDFEGLDGGERPDDAGGADEAEGSDDPAHHDGAGRAAAGADGGPGAPDVESIIGAALVVRGDALRRIGPIDEGYFMYFEDVDLGLRARRAGYRLGRVALWLDHAPETSSSTRRPFLRSWLSVRNSIRMFVKHRRSELPAWLRTLVRTMVTRDAGDAAHLLRLRPFGPLGNLLVLAAALAWNVATLPKTWLTLRREAGYRTRGWTP